VYWRILHHLFNTYVTLLLSGAVVAQASLVDSLLICSCYLSTRICRPNQKYVS